MIAPSENPSELSDLVASVLRRVLPETANDNISAETAGRNSLEAAAIADCEGMKSAETRALHGALVAARVDKMTALTAWALYLDLKTNARETLQSPMLEICDQVFGPSPSEPAKASR